MKVDFEKAVETFPKEQMKSHEGARNVHLLTQRLDIVIMFKTSPADRDKSAVALRRRRAYVARDPAYHVSRSGADEERGAAPGLLADSIAKLLLTSDGSN